MPGLEVRPSCIRQCMKLKFIGFQCGQERVGPIRRCSLYLAVFADAHGVQKGRTHSYLHLSTKASEAVILNQAFCLMVHCLVRASVCHSGHRATSDDIFLRYSEVMPDARRSPKSHCCAVLQYGGYTGRIRCMIAHLSFPPGMPGGWSHDHVDEHRCRRGAPEDP